MHDLVDDLELACADVLRGDPWGPLTASRLQRTCTDVLRGRGLRPLKVQARSDASGTHVLVVLRGPGAQVRELVVHLG